MGVMNCSRPDCDNIMCDTYIYDIGYICTDCQNEFKEYLSKEGINVTTEREIRKELEIFMETRKGSYIQDKEMDVDDFFDSYTRN